MLIDPPRRCTTVNDLKAKQLQVVRLPRCDLDDPAGHTIVVGQNAIHGPSNKAGGLVTVKRTQQIGQCTTEQASMIRTSLSGLCSMVSVLNSIAGGQRQTPRVAVARIPYRNNRVDKASDPVSEHR